MLRSWTCCLFLSLLLVPTANHDIPGSKHGEPLWEKPITEEVTISKFPEQCTIQHETVQSIAVTLKYMKMEQDGICTIDDDTEYDPGSSPDSWMLKKRVKWKELAGGWSESQDSNLDRAERALPLPPSVLDALSINQTAELVYCSKHNSLLPLVFVLLFLLFNMVTFIPAGAEEGINGGNAHGSGEPSGPTRRSRKPWWKWWLCRVNGEGDDPPE